MYVHTCATQIYYKEFSIHVILEADRLLRVLASWWTRNWQGSILNASRLDTRKSPYLGAWGLRQRKKSLSFKDRAGEFSTQGSLSLSLYSGLRQTGWGLPTLEVAICFTQPYLKWIIQKTAFIEKLYGGSLKNQPNRSCSYAPAIPLLAHIQKTIDPKEACTLMFIVALFTTDQTWKQSKCRQRNG